MVNSPRAGARKMAKIPNATRDVGHATRIVGCGCPQGAGWPVCHDGSDWGILGAIRHWVNAIINSPGVTSVGARYASLPARLAGTEVRLIPVWCEDSRRDDAAAVTQGFAVLPAVRSRIGNQAELTLQVMRITWEDRNRRID